MGERQNKIIRKFGAILGFGASIPIFNAFGLHALCLALSATCALGLVVSCTLGNVPPLPEMVSSDPGRSLAPKVRMEVKGVLRKPMNE